MIKIHQNYFIESIPSENVKPDQIRQSNYKFRNNHNIENKLTLFQIYPETKLACKYTKQFYKTQYSEILVEYEQGFDMNTGNLTIHPMATSHSTIDENSYIPVNLDMKLDYTISRIFQEMSLTELETLHQLCELERTQILQSLALAVLKIPYAGYLLSVNRSNFIYYEGNVLWYYTCTKKVSPLYVFDDKRCYK